MKREYSEMTEIVQNQPTREQVVALIVDSLQELLAMDGAGESDAVDEETRLLGRSAVVESMGLVTLIVEVEQRLESDFDVVVVLADDRAMSQSRSPFLSVGTLADYICQLLEEQA